MSAANVDKSWIGFDAAALFAQVTGRKMVLLNDADAADIAEMTFSAGKGEQGVVIVLTFGTGIGSAIFLDGRLLPNAGWPRTDADEGHHRRALLLRTHPQEEDLKWSEWAIRTNHYLTLMDLLFSPDSILSAAASAKVRSNGCPCSSRKRRWSQPSFSTRPASSAPL
ncbi:MAG: ROK family protein [Caldilineaceae bacterium]